jgi:hypothetical protein
MTGWRIRRVAPVALKIAISAALVTFVATRVNLGEYRTILSALSPVPVAAVIAIFIFQITVISAYRLKTLLAIAGCRVPTFRACCVTWSGFFVEQIGAVFVAGDVVRIWLLRQAGVDSLAALEAPLLDRAIGLGCLVLLATFGMHPLWLGLSAGQQDILLMLLAAMLVLMVLAVLAVARGWCGSSKLLASLYAAIRSIFGTLARRSSHPKLAGVTLLALTTHTLNIFAMYLLLGAVDAKVSLSLCFLFTPTVLLVSIMPASISGWGIRESAMLVALHNFKIPPAEIVTASVLFGGCALVCSLPGALIWLSMPSRRELAEAGEAAAVPDRAAQAASS